MFSREVALCNGKGPYLGEKKQSEFHGLLRTISVTFKKSSDVI